jgi:hypothetical protein
MSRLSSVLGVRGTALVLGLLAGLLSDAAEAGPVLDIGCQNSRAIYGIEARHIEHYGCWMDIESDGTVPPLDDWWFVRIFWGNTSPALQQLTFETDSSGAVVQSHYAYAGGTFELEFRLQNDLTGQDIIGSAVLPILSMDVFSDEGDDGFGRVKMYATLGTGTLDASVANVLGIGQNIVGGTLADPFLGRRGPSDTDYTAAYREASEGGPTLRVQIPEPPLWMLGALGVAAVRRRLRRLASAGIRHTTGPHV